MGQLIQNLGFLSSSLDQQAAQEFMSNVIFQIKI